MTSEPGLLCRKHFFCLLYHIPTIRQLYQSLAGHTRDTGGGLGKYFIEVRQSATNGRDDFGYVLLLEIIYRARLHRYQGSASLSSVKIADRECLKPSMRSFFFILGKEISLAYLHPTGILFYPVVSFYCPSFKCQNTTHSDSDMAKNRR